MTQRFKYPGVPIETGLPGYNEYGVPFHACRGIIQDEHYWAWIAFKNRGQA